MQSITLRIREHPVMLQALAPQAAMAFENSRLFATSSSTFHFTLPADLVNQSIAASDV